MKQNFHLVFISLIISCGCNFSGNNSHEIKGEIVIDTTYLVEDIIKGYKLEKYYSKDSLIHAFHEIISKSARNPEMTNYLKAFFRDSCFFSSEARLIGTIQKNELFEFTFRIDSCTTEYSILDCIEKSCHTYICIAVKNSSNSYKPLIFNHVRFDEYPEPTVIYDIEGNKIISVYSTISGNMGETKEFYFTESNDTLKIFEPWKNLQFEKIELADSVFFKKQGYFNIKKLKYYNSLWHQKDHYHWPTLGGIEIQYTLKNGEMIIKDYKIIAPTDENEAWKERREE